MENIVQQVETPAERLMSLDGLRLGAGVLGQ